MADPPFKPSPIATRTRAEVSVGAHRARTDRTVAELLDAPDGSLVDLVDSLLDKGVVLDGEIVLGLADIDLIYVRLAAVVAAADKVLPRK